jgi:TetR/AcrR family macrolide resistance operon transcriptional repressor
VNNEEILMVAWRVMARRGYDSFTLAEVAEEVGLSRAAIILRFKSTKALRLQISSHMADRFEQRLDAVPASRSGDALLDFADMIGKWIATHDKFATFMTILHRNVQDEELAAVERRRGEVLQRAIAARMPKTALDLNSAVLSFRAQLSGSMMQWEVESGISPSEYLIARTQDWLTLAQIKFTPRASSTSEPSAKIKRPKADTAKFIPAPSDEWTTKSSRRTKA